MDRLQEEIFRYTPPPLKDERSQQLGAWVRRQLQSVPNTVDSLSTRINEVMRLEDNDRIKQTVGRRHAGLKSEPKRSP
jgi:hypothetical protein